ncbi:hypothetical protein [Nonomuraea typhae]|uniref:hypothetical protein n=1 Tax=Nonomuraea typhae TaxID=2603600 RepID=UPI0012FC9214|nr:hypothetical protein [Nonomuraea typhae]
MSYGAVPALTGPGVDVAAVGLGKPAGVIGVSVALIGLGVAIFGAPANRKPGNGAGRETPSVAASGQRPITIRGANSRIAPTGDDTTTLQR